MTLGSRRPLIWLLRRNLPSACNPEGHFALRQQRSEHTHLLPRSHGPVHNQRGRLERSTSPRGRQLLVFLKTGTDCPLGRSGVNRALGKLAAGSGYKDSLWTGQERLCCHLPKALRLALEKPQLPLEEERGGGVRGAESSSEQI